MIFEVFRKFCHILFVCILSNSHIQTGKCATQLYIYIFFTSVKILWSIKQLNFFFPVFHLVKLWGVELKLEYVQICRIIIILSFSFSLQFCSKTCQPPMKCGRCRDPFSDDTWWAPLSGSTLAVSPQEDTWRTPLSGSLREEHTTLASIMPGRQYILPGYIVRIIDCSEQALLSHPRQPATTHVPPPAEREDKSDGKSPPTISDSRLQGDDGPATTLRASWGAKKSSHH